MLSKIKLNRRAAKQGYKERRERYEHKLSALQRRARELGVPVLIVFEGWDAAGKGTLINELILALDPRGFSVHSTREPTEEEALRPLLWPFWVQTPASGRIAIFDRSWYYRLLSRRCEEGMKAREYGPFCDDIRAFERQLADDGVLIIKIFLHISRKEQKRRLDRLRANRATAWRVTDSDLKQHRRYRRYFKATEELLSRTNTRAARWTVVPAHDRRFAALRIFRLVAGVMERGIARAETDRGGEPTPATAKAFAPRVLRLGDVDPSRALEREDYDRKKRKLQRRLRELEHEVYRHRVPVIIVYEGRDAAGKGGNIRRLTQKLDPRGYEVVPIIAPNEVEKQHHYFRRFWKKLPKAGHITVFDRSWYGRVLVERVEEFATESEWRRAYREINEVEQHWTRCGVLLLKFWLQIDADEQLRRFRERERVLHKRWKITEEDWRNRRKSKAYRDAAEEMLFRTDRPDAPWHIVATNCKLYARIHVMKTVVRAIEESL